MTNFDNDDALGDLLSDGSNDSFFEEPKTLAKRASLTKPPDKKAISDLFGLNDEKPKEKIQSKESDWLGLGGAGDEKPSVAEPPKSAISNPDRTSLHSAKLTKKISFEDDDDILSSLVLEKKSETTTDVSRETDTLQRKIEPVKKSALIESIFGPPKQQSTETISSFEDILKDSKINKQKTAVTSSKPAPSENLSYGPPEGRRSRHHSSGSGVLDPLGLFSNEPTISKEREETSKKPSKPIHGEGDAKGTDLEILHPKKPKDLKTKSASNIKDLPEWLGGGSPVKTHKSDTAIHKTEKTDQQQTRRGSVQYVEAKEPEVEIDKTETKETIATELPMLESLLTQQKLATSHIEYQNTSIALQQQESQLLMALQLKKYEENLAEMQRKQQEVLVKQEQQFNSLLERQFAKQQIMENNMRMQQERINNHIQLLISQPPIAGSKVNEDQEEMMQLKKNNVDENSRLYEEMIVTLKQRQHEEIFLLNESYKKQISLLESSMDAVENRLKTELTNLSEQFRNTVENIKKDHETEIDKYKQKLQEMTTLHVNEIKLIRENHNRIIEEIKYEYSSMVENMKQVKQTESSVLDNANTYSQKLDSNLEILDTNSKILIGIQERVQQDYGVLSLAREESLKAKEEEIRCKYNA
ncbi:hypothetical protein ILUMI_03597 [Ignelater luminosus]|uniref:Fas-binding factor 1 C-terminal domain-containing protein n=1 Tax=Ignelater luminosus TaxID=2038154 RepID=A0A8K0DLH2_IGNLU|nr:hypothetical protein ILUMI_03597 [Ignelater luminosus]